VAARRGRGKTVCARGAWVALLGGPATSPLGGVRASHFLTESQAFATMRHALPHSGRHCQCGDHRTIATGSGIREIARLRKRYGRGRWRKRKGTAEIELPGGEIVLAELHWYEATGIGRREFKIKRLLER